MKTKIYTIDGKQGKDIELPKCFSGEIREDVVAKVVEAVKQWQPYSVSPIAGRQQNAAGKIVHRRHVWRSGYGHGISRVPRKIMSRRGNRFNWVAAEVPHVVGGRRAHPPKNKLNVSKINKKEMKIAMISGLSASADKKMIEKKYDKISELDKEVPFIVEGKIAGLKTKQFLDRLKKIFGDKLFDVAIQRKTIRAGRGTMRGRKYKKNAGALVVLGKSEDLKVKGIEVQKTNSLDIIDLCMGGAGRIVIYTENAIKELGEKFK